ncbi:zwei Ig domain protein zig-8 [Nasonia vitripennis]|uniref:Ig-like domain-containing protein n=1 Tax=Nasonia vitripennis TaxID=7425 RepID=A0A7M7Q152_NASVI|nr:zwei Ig domain protein zig-8 [Nasonia vitripennis]XP_031780209.1 zwei Ig domain protein zig-8 [Nasonia vitripennis]
MSLGRAWGSRLILTLATATIVIANHQHRHRYAFSYFHDSYTDSRKLSNNITRSFDDFKSSNYHHQQHQQLGGVGPLRVPHLRHHHTVHRGPYFENAEGQEINDSQNVAHLGDTALLDCRVVMLSGKMVMWVRQSPDKALLTVGEHTHIADPRYAVRFKYPNNWRLAISAIQKEDRGLYVCQVNTHPPRMLVTNVTILAPDIRIVDEANHELRDRYYKTGSIIELTCMARPSRPGSKVPHPVWKKNGETLPDHVNVYHTNGTDNELLTRLRIEHAKKSDSGEFSCSIGQFSTTVVNIHVLNGEKQAAVHHDQWNSAKSSLSQAPMLPKLLSSLVLLLSTLNVCCELS